MLYNFINPLYMLCFVLENLTNLEQMSSNNMLICLVSLKLSVLRHGLNIKVLKVSK